MIEFIKTPHGLSILVVVIFIVILQLYFYFKNKKSRNIFLLIFPVDVKKQTVIKKNGNNVEGLEASHHNKIWDVIINSINNYLSNNKGNIGGFHLIKDIVDRNCDAQEEEINSQVPVPLYLGLVGTMAGILIGIAFLVFTGGLNGLLNNTNNNGAEGVEALLGGVALAMLSSIVGIILTTRGTLRFKSEKVKVEADKNTFLSWMYAELLPELLDDTANVLQKMTQDLSNFNKTFSENNVQFTSSLAKVADTSEKQAELIQLISQLRDKDITQNNLALLNKLIEVSKHIGTLGADLQSVNIYTESLHHILRGISDYFKAEREQIEQRKDTFNNSLKEISNVIAQQLPELFNQADLKVRNALEEFNKNFLQSLKIIQESLDGQILSFNSKLEQQQTALQATLDKQHETLLKSVDEQQKAFVEKLQNTSKLVDELNNIGDKIASITRLEQAIREQNGKLDKLAVNIKELAQKAGGSTIVFTIPKWIKIVAILSFGILTLSGITYLFTIIF